VFGSLLLLVFLVNFGRIVFAPLLDHFITVFGVGEATVGLVATLAWFGSAAPRLPTGYLLTKVPRHHVVLGTGLLLAGASGFTAVANSIWQVGIGAFVIGTASGAYFIAANPLVSELFPDRVGRVIGLHGTASQIAAVVAPLTVGALIAAYSWRAIFVLLAAVALLGTAALWIAARRTQLPDHGRRNRHLRRSVRNQWPIIVTGVAVIGVAGFVWNGFFNFYVRYLTTTKAVSPGVAQTLLTLMFAAGVPAFFYAGRLADRVPYVPLMLSILVAFFTSLFAFTLVEGLVAIAVVTVAMGLIIHSMFPTIDTYLLDSLPDEDRSSAYSAYSATMMLFGSTASVVVGTLVQAGYAFDLVYRVFGLVLVVVTVVLVVLRWANRLPDAAR
jgi:predicted MFS family arabinose efflux permease